jgi:hypothetical protein
MNSQKKFMATNACTSTIRRGAFMAIALGLVTCTAIGPTYAHNTHSEGAGSIEGTWVVTVSPPNNLAPPHNVLVSFARGGVTSGIPDIYLPPVAGTMESPFGNWSQIGRNQYVATIAAFTHDDAGKVTGAVRIDFSYRITDGGTLEGQAHLNLCDLSFNCSSAGPATAALTGTRLPIYPVNNASNTSQ